MSLANLLCFVKQRMELKTLLSCLGSSVGLCVSSAMDETVVAYGSLYMLSVICAQSPAFWVTTIEGANNGSAGVLGLLSVRCLRCQPLCPDRQQLSGAQIKNVCTLISFSRLGPGEVLFRLRVPEWLSDRSRNSVSILNSAGDEAGTDAFKCSRGSGGGGLSSPCSAVSSRSQRETFANASVGERTSSIPYPDGWLNVSSETSEPKHLLLTVLQRGIASRLSFCLSSQSDVSVAEPALDRNLPSSENFAGVNLFVINRKRERNEKTFCFNTYLSFSAILFCFWDLSAKNSSCYSRWQLVYSA